MITKLRYVFLCAALAISQAHASSWTGPVRVSPNGGGGPDVAVGPVSGVPYVAYTANWDPNNGNAYEVLLARAVKNGRTFDWTLSATNPKGVSPRTNSLGTPAKSLGVALAIGSKAGQEQIHCMWWDHIGTEDFLYSRSYDGGLSWSAPLNLTNNGTAQNGQNVMAADNLGNVYLVYSDNQGGCAGNCLNIWFRKFNGTTNAWEAAKMIETNYSTKSQAPRICLDAAGGIHVVWKDRIASRGLRYCYSADKGATFTSPQVVFSAVFDTPSNTWKEDMGDPALAVSTDGTVYASAIAGPDYSWTPKFSAYIYMSSKAPGGSWTPREIVPGSDPPAYPWLVADAANHVFMSWLRYPPARPGYDIMFRQRNSLGWATATNVTNDGLWKGYTGGHLAIDKVNNFIHIATDDTIDTDNLGHQIYVWSLDLREPPMPVINAAIQNGDGLVDLSWKNQNESDIGAVRIIYRTDRFPTSPADGALAIEKLSPANSTDLYTHTGLTNGVTYYYSIYTRDDYAQYSAAVQLIGNPKPFSVATAKLQLDGKRADLTDVTVSAVFKSDSVIYVEEPDRSSGIRVAYSGTAFIVGDVVNVSGSTATRIVSGYPAERFITSATITSTGKPNSPLKPLTLTAQHIGGEANLPYLPGVQGAFGLNNIGLLVRYTGKVTTKITTNLWVDDGAGVIDPVSVSGALVKCPDSNAPFSVNDTVAVTGIIEGNISSGDTSNRRQIRIRDYSDITKLN
ncbi:MAG: sialidase family protein [Armatimonadota bacterium]